MKVRIPNARHLLHPAITRFQSRFIARSLDAIADSFEAALLHQPTHPRHLRLARSLRSTANRIRSRHSL